MIVICFRVLVLLLNRVLLLRPDLLKYFKRDNVPCLPQVSSGFLSSFPLSSFCPFQPTFFFTLPPRSVLKVNSLTHSPRTVNGSRLFPSAIPNFSPEFLRCSAASTNGKSRIPAISLSSTKIPQQSVLQQGNLAPEPITLFFPHP